MIYSIKRIGTAAVFAACLWAMAQHNAYAATITVNTAADGAVAGQCSLRDAIRAANTNAAVNGCAAGSGTDIIVFAASLANSTITLTTGQLNITDTLAIDATAAPGLTVSGNNASRVFNIGEPVTLISITIANGRATGAGGGILSSEPLTLTQVNVLTNTATEDGGGVFAADTTKVTNGVFRGNRATSAISLGGGLYTDGNLTVNGTQFISNSARVDGGGVFAAFDAAVANARFISNTSRSNGGGLYVAGNLSASAAHFISNTATQAGGGAYVEDAVVLTDTQFISNTSGDTGGGLHVDSTAKVTGSQFSHNMAGSLGGGLYTYDVLSATQTSFVGNIAVEEGGGIYADAEVTASDLEFVGNVAGTLGGGARVFYPTTLHNSRFIDNRAVRGGGLSADDALTVTNGAFIGNIAARGAGLHHDYRSVPVLVVNSLFASNAVTVTGAALYVEENAGIRLIHTTIASPTLANGAAIAVLTGTVGVTNTIIASHTTGISRTTGIVNEDYNLFYGNTIDRANVAAGANSLNGDPAFVSPALADYHLTASSAALERGVNAGVSVDFDGHTRPQGSAPDIGFDEFPASADLTIAKVAVSGGVQGQPVVYRISYSNAGGGVATNVVITDIVPAQVSSPVFTGSGATIAPVAGTTFVWNVADLPPGASGIITVTGTLDPAVDAGTVFTNTARIDAAMDSLGSNNASTAVLTVSESSRAIYLPIVVRQ
jgi:uncharacterized repeat protein (TIGR01451 family)/CSLREA domain-containing protein